MEYSIVIFESLRSMYLAISWYPSKNPSNSSFHIISISPYINKTKKQSQLFDQKARFFSIGTKKKHIVTQCNGQGTEDKDWEGRTLASARFPHGFPEGSPHGWKVAGFPREGGRNRTTFLSQMRWWNGWFTYTFYLGEQWPHSICRNSWWIVFFFWGGVNIHETLHGACGFETMEDVTLNWNLLQLEISLSEGIRR